MSLPDAQKCGRIAELLLAAPEKPDRQIAALVGGSHKVPARIRAQMEAAGQIPRMTRARTRPISKPARNVALFDPKTGPFRVNIRDIRRQVIRQI
jgi:hypothetical protein